MSIIESQVDVNTNFVHAEGTDVPESTSITTEDKVTIEEFIANPDNKKAAAEVAFQIQKDYQGWFSIPKLIKRYKVSQEEMAKQIEVLMLFGLCVGKVKDNKPLFRIDLDNKVQRQILTGEISKKEKEIAFLKEKLSKLN